jgi:enoyl-CoA hydratase/carnithine racemase
MPQSELLPRAWELAEQMAKNSDIVLRYTRVAMNLVIKRQIHDLLGYGLALEGLGSADTMLDQG